MKISSTATALMAVFALIGTLMVAGIMLAPPQPHNIHYVNYRGKTDIDAGFESYLRAKGVKYTITYHDADRDDSNFGKILQNIRSDREVDVVVSWGTTVTLNIFGTKNESGANKVSGVPGVFVLVTDPVNSNLMNPGDTSGRNLTGSWHVAPIISQFRSMMIYRPSKKIGILYNPAEKNSVVSVEEMKRVAALHSVAIVTIPFDIVDGKPTSGNATAALKKMKDEGVEWLYLPPDSFLGQQARDLVIPVAHGLQMATFASTEQLMKTGAAFGLVSSYFELGEITAAKVEKILVEGVPASQIPVDTVPRFRHQMNQQVAEKLGITVDPKLLQSIEILN